jgi:acyl-CoA thioester hydrolase
MAIVERSAPMSELVNRTPVRVYYEDTDFSGRVYHASFVRFLERGRTEWLRQMGLRHDALAQTQTAFAVTRLEIDFRAPAFIDDTLDVATGIATLKGAALRFLQHILRGEQVLVVAEAQVVTISHNRPVRPPRELVERLRNLGVNRTIDAVAERGEPQC